jgi:hypothetical protein
MRRYKIRLRETVLVLNISTSLQTTLAAEAHLAERKFSLEKQKSLMILRRKSKTKSFQKRTEFKTNVNLNKECDNSSYVCRAILIALKLNSNGHGKEIIKEKAESFCWIRFSFLPSAGIKGFQTKGIFKLKSN